MSVGGQRNQRGESWEKCVFKAAPGKLENTKLTSVKNPCGIKMISLLSKPLYISTVSEIYYLKYSCDIILYNICLINIMYNYVLFRTVTSSETKIR